MIAAILGDPRLINFVLLALYAANAARWALHEAAMRSTGPGR